MYRQTSCWVFIYPITILNNEITGESLTLPYIFNFFALTSFCVLHFAFCT